MCHIISKQFAHEEISRISLYINCLIIHLKPVGKWGWHFGQPSFICYLWSGYLYSGNYHIRYMHNILIYYFEHIIWGLFTNANHLGRGKSSTLYQLSGSWLELAMQWYEEHIKLHERQAVVNFEEHKKKTIVFRIQSVDIFCFLSFFLSVCLQNCRFVYWSYRRLLVVSWLHSIFS